jgi:hypothetical protein
LVIEKVGKGRYGGMGYYVFPDKPEQAILNNNLLELDWKAGRWRTDSTLWRGTKENEIFGFDPYTRFGRIIKYRGRRLVVHTSFYPENGATVISELTEDGMANPLVAMGPVVSALPKVFRRYQGGLEPSPILADHLWTEPLMNQAARKVAPWFFEGPVAGGRVITWRQFLGEIMAEARKAGLKLVGRPKSNGPNANFAWSDLNGNGGVEEDEIVYHATPGLPGPLPVYWAPEAWAGGVVGDDLTVYLSAVQDGKSYHYRLPVARWTDSGVPVYDPQKAELIVASPYMGQAAWLSSDGNLLALGNIPGNFDSRDPLTMYRPDGSIAWTFPSPWTGVHGSHTAPKEKRGQLVGPLGVFGEAQLEGVGEIFAFHTNVGTAEFFTADGLYIGRLFKDGRSAPDPWPDQPRRGQSLNDVTNGGEWFGGQFFQRPDGRMFVICSRDAGVLAEVHGLDSARRLGEQSIAFSPAQYEQAQALLAEGEKDEDETRSMQVVAMKPGRPVPPLDAFRWDANRSASWRYDETRGAQASWGYDENNLYVAFQVEDDTPMINSGEDVRRLFKFGDAAILELRTDPTQKSKEAAKGDLRLLFSVHEGKPVAVLYDYRHPGATDPVEFTSVKTTRIDRLEVLDEAQVAIDRSDSGYTLRAAVPLKALGWKPEAGVTYPGDFGIVYSDRAGQTNQLRMYWSNQATGIVSDLSLEADIQPGNWGRFEIEQPR